MKTKIFVLVILIAVLVLSACSVSPSGQIVEGNLIAPETGQVYALHLRSTLHGMKQASVGAAGTKLFRNKNLITFVWTLKDGWAFATINLSTKQPIQHFANVAGNANFVNVKTMKDVVRIMGENGWKMIPASALPTSVVTALHGGMSWLTTMANSMVSFFVVPAGAFMTPEILQGYEQVEQ